MAHRGTFSLGTDAEMLVYYVRSGPTLWSADDPYTPHPPSTRSELESVRRALRNLRKKGLVFATKYRRVIYAPGPEETASGGAITAPPPPALFLKLVRSEQP